MPLNTVAEFISRVRDLCDLNPEREKPAIFVAGPVNSGKSTLVNSLLEHRICPDDASPSTLFPIYFRHSETPGAYKTVNGKNIQLPERELRDVLRNRKKNLVPDKAEVLLPSGLLRLCSLVDTPGTGSGEEADSRIRDLLSGADGIIFVFHQRGIDATAHIFLTGLAAAGIKGWISFWVNTNLGLIDGTSLVETGKALRAIFPGRSEVHAINTRDRASTGLLSQFLQVKSLEWAVRGIDERVSGRDRLIPGLVERASLIEDDNRFLLKFWEAFEQAGTINSTRQAVRDLPLIYGSLASMLRAETFRLSAGSTAAPDMKKGRRGSPGPSGKISSLAREMEADRDLIRYADRDLLEKLAGSLDEKCRVMVAGSFSTGKTTFLNALLGETLLPAEDRATTSCAVRVGYGSEKKAAVEYLFRAQFHPVSVQGGKYILDREEMIAVTQILDSAPVRAMITDCQICREGLYKSVPLSQLAEILEEICRFYSRNPGGAVSPEKVYRVPLFTRRAAAPSLPAPAVTAVRFTLDGRGPKVFRLDDNRQRLEFYRAISPPGSYLVESVTISHPSANLVSADFIDTPGLDSPHQRHRHRAAEALSPGDLGLVFLHAKHVLARGVSGHVSAIQKLAANIPVIYVINFADTVSETDREKVSLYIRQKLGHNNGSKEAIPYPQVYTISALNALRHGDDGFDRLLRRVQKKTGEIEGRKIIRDTAEISQWLKKISDPARQKNIPDRTRQAARYYLAELEKLQQTYLLITGG